MPESNPVHSVLRLLNPILHQSQNGQRRTGMEINRERESVCEKRKIQQEKKEEEERLRQKDSDNYYHPSPIYDPTDKEDTSAPVRGKDLDPNYYPPNYKEYAPILTDDLIQKPTPEIKEVDKLEGEKGEKEEGLQQ